ncbi:MAG: multicopper oxidase family protein [Pseudomonadota bacterium]
MTSSIKQMGTFAFLVFSILNVAGYSPVFAETAHHTKEKPSQTDHQEANAKTLSDIAPKDAAFVKKSTTIEVQDGATITLIASIVKQKIGNRLVKRLAYNGMIPGPILKAKVGTSISLKVINRTNIETTLHSHGLRLGYLNDGVPGVGQAPIKPGEEFVYKITFPDTGLFWYHPHIREDYAQEMGLYGSYVVTPVDPKYYNPVDREENIILDDLNLNSQGQMPKFLQEETNYALMGRFGNILLANNDPKYQIKVREGEVVRFLLTNASNTRVYRLSAKGVSLKKIASDQSRYEKEENIEEAVLAPAERLVVEAYFPKSGEFSFEHRGSSKSQTLFKVQVKKQKGFVAQNVKDFQNLRSLTEITKEMESVRKLQDSKPEKEIVLSVTIPEALKEHMKHMNHGSAPAIEWDDPMESMNYESTSKDIFWKIIDKSSGKTNMDIDWKFKLNSLTKIRIYNDPNSDHPMHHPIHFHGQRFVVTALDGKPLDNLVWKDTALVPNGSTMDIVLDASNPGKWMAHCHIAEHLHSGMMLGFDVM